jgi:hypothetical protein
MRVIIGSGMGSLLSEFHDGLAPRLEALCSDDGLTWSWDAQALRVAGALVRYTVNVNALGILMLDLEGIGETPGVGFQAIGSALPYDRIAMWIVVAAKRAQHQRSVQERQGT